MVMAKEPQTNEESERKVNYRLCTIEEVPEWIRAKVNSLKA